MNGFFVQSIRESPDNRYLFYNSVASNKHPRAHRPLNLVLARFLGVVRTRQIQGDRFGVGNADAGFVTGSAAGPVLATVLPAQTAGTDAGLITATDPAVDSGTDFSYTGGMSPAAELAGAIVAAGLVPTRFSNSRQLRCVLANQALSSTEVSSPPRD